MINILKNYTRFSRLPVRPIRESIYFAVVIYILLLPLKLVFVPNDHEGYLEFMDEASSLAGIGDPEAKGKLWVALIYGYINQVVPYQFFTSLVFLIYLFVVCRHSLNIKTMMFHFLLIAPISPYFGYITKEALILSSLLLVYFSAVYRSFLSLPAFYLLMGVFSIFVRQYYIPFIILSFFAVRLNVKVMLFFLALISIPVLLFGDDLFEYLYLTKEEMWVRLRYYSVVNTLFPLEFSSAAGLWELVEIWLMNLWYILTTIVRHPSLVGLASFLNIILVSIVFKFTYGLAKRDVWLFALFSLVFMTFLVPDSGTFVRHSTLLSMVAIFGVLINRPEVEDVR